MSHVFISYGKDSIDFARHLRRLLEREGFAVWMDEARLAPSNRWWHEIEHNIATCDAFVVIMTPSGRRSDWVEREILLAERASRPVFPVLLSGEVWSRLANIQYTDMQSGQEMALPAGLIQSLREVVTSAPPAPLPLRQDAPSPPPAAIDPQSAELSAAPAQPIPLPKDVTPPPEPRRRRRGARSCLMWGVRRVVVLSALALVAILALVWLIQGDLTGGTNDDDPAVALRDPDQDGGRPFEEMPEDEQRAILVERLHSTNRHEVIESLDMLREFGWLYDGSLEGGDLREVNFSEMNLEGAQLMGVNFSGSELQGAVFREANLENSAIYGANLSGASFQGAHLVNADIVESDVRGARFVGANLSGTELVYSNFEEANFNEADLSGANLEQSNLRWSIIDGTRFSVETILPDGQHWQTYTNMGRYLLPDTPQFWRSDDPNSPAHS